jgi:hypothetical protein
LMPVLYSLWQLGAPRLMTLLPLAAVQA